MVFTSNKQRNKVTYTGICVDAIKVKGADNINYVGMCSLSMTKPSDNNVQLAI